MSKTMVWAWAAVPALFVPISIQSTRSEPSALAPSKERLVRVQQDDGARASSEEREFDAAAWRQRLSASDLDARERAFDELTELGRSDAKARRAVKDWARDEHAGELAWTSRLLLREIDRTAANARRSSTPWPGVGGLGMDPFQERLEELHRQFGGMNSLFSDLERQMQEFQRALPHPGAAPFGGGPRFGGTGGWRSHSGFSMQSGPDGVKVEIEEGEGDERHTKTYEAKSIEELLEAHPELEGRIHGGGGWLRLDGASVPPAPSVPLNPFAAPARPLEPAALDESKLGIHWSAVDGEFAAEHDLESGVGLHVNSTVPGSLAEKLGIRAGDTVVELQGETIRAAEDVQRVLAAREKDEKLSCTVIDGKGKERTLTFKPKQDRAKSKKKEAETGPRF